MAQWQAIIDGEYQSDIQSVSVLSTIAGSQKFGLILSDVENLNTIGHFSDIEIWSPSTGAPGGLIFNGVDDWINLANTLEMEHDNWAISWWMKKDLKWLLDWVARQVITLTGSSSGAQTDYPIKLTIPYDGNMQADFDDLRFTEADGSTLLDAWLESKTNSVSATVWVKFPTTPADGETAEYHMYYGNSSVSNNWSGPDTFLQYHGAASSNFSDTESINEDFAYESNARVTGTTDDVYFGVKNTGGAYHSIRSGPMINLRYGYAYNETGGTYFSESPKFTQNTWYKLLIASTHYGVHAYVDLNEIASGTSSDYFPDDDIGLYMDIVAGGGEQEWSFIRKYVTNPATYAFGSEEKVKYEYIFLENNTSYYSAIMIHNTSKDFWMYSPTGSWAGKFDPGSIYDGEWHHFVLNFGSSATTLYVDNVVADTDTANSDPANFEINAIGKHRTGFNSFGGSLADIRVYDETIDLAEIARLYAGIYDAPCKAFYTLTQSSAVDDAIYDRFEGSHGTSYTAASTKGALELDTSPLNQFIAFKGRVEILLPDYDTDTLDISGRDYVSELLSRSVVESYGDPTPILRSAIVSDIVLKYGTSMSRRGIGDSPSGTEVEYLFKTSAWDAVVKCAKDDGYRFFADTDKDFNYHVKGWRDSGKTIEVGIDDVLRYKIIESGSEVINMVTVFGYDDGVDQIIVMGEDLTSQDYYGIINEKRIVDLSIMTESDAEDFLYNYLDEHSYVLEIVELELLGSETLTPGDLITLKIPAINIDGLYLIIDKLLSYPSGITSIKVAKYAKNLEVIIADMVEKILMLERYFMEEGSTTLKLHRVNEETLHTDRIVLEKRAADDSFKIGVPGWSTIGTTKIGGRGAEWTEVYDSGY